MHGPVLSMSPAFDTAPAFSRAQSFSDLPSLADDDYTRPKLRGESEELPRAASYTSIPALEASQYTLDKQAGRAATVQISPVISDENKNGVTEAEEHHPGQSREESPKPERMGRRKSLVARPKSWISSLKQQYPEPSFKSPGDIPPVPSLPKAGRSKSRSVSKSFATLARKSWISSSRSPSPCRTVLDDLEQSTEDGEAPKENSSNALSSVPQQPAPIQPEIEKPSPAILAISPSKLSRRTSAFQKMKQRPQSVLMSFTTFASANSSSSSLPRSSMDNRSTPRTSVDKLPPLPSNEKFLNVPATIVPKKDELGSAFRSLDNDFTKFQGKTWSLKTNVVRAQLLPFLKNHASHPSNKLLQPEDLDRRIVVLNKWWRGLLEVLDSRQNQTVSGVDRPVLLEAAAAIMTRPEWRMGPSSFAPLYDRLVAAPERTLRRQRSSSSVASASSQFLSDSIHHNIRNLFTENLLTQMRFVVNKMSLRHAPASLVTFCGKACAYAFFFVPGVANILVRLWKIQADCLRKVSDELGLPRRKEVAQVNEMVAGFPSQIHDLAWSSVKSMSNHLRQRPEIPIATSLIPWDGPWIARWCGRDSDMCFVFVKHYHILAEDFFPLGLSLTEKARAPGFVLVQAQILSVFEATIHRQPATGPPPVTFDEVLAGADANAAALPLPSNNSTRLMAENRLIMLLRDFVSDRTTENALAKATFAESFSKVMQAAARRTSVYNHSSCFLLCDFIEETLAIYIRFQHTYALESDFVDWEFWLEVWKKMLESQNTMSELRVFAFIYGAWPMLTADERRKEIVVLDWLVSEETFNKYFTHWCPMVRAYYMRLLCWRICRDDGEANELDTKIYATVLQHLKANYARYLFLRQQAEKCNVLPPSTTPALPAPGRRLLIIRNDNQVPATSLFVGFDGIMSPASRAAAAKTIQPTATSKRNTLSSLTQSSASDNNVSNSQTDAATNSSKKNRWSIIGKILPANFTGSTDDLSSSPTRAASPTKNLEEARRETALARSRPAIPGKTSSSDSIVTSTSTHRSFSFKFSLEWAQNFGKRDETHQNQGAGKRGSGSFGNERRILSPRLPAAAHTWLGSRVPGLNAEVQPLNPAEGACVNVAKRLVQAKYSGRALAEWTFIVSECNNFTDRRREEGVPSLRLVEIPTLSVEGFKKFS